VNQLRGFSVPAGCFVLSLLIAQLSGPSAALGLRKPQKHTGQEKCDPLGDWESEVKGEGFNAKLKGNGTVQAHFPTAAPNAVQNQTVPLKEKRKVSDNVTLRVFVDFPRNAQGKPTGMRFKEEKNYTTRFGALGIFVADCCPEGCFIPTITSYKIIVLRNGQTVATLKNQTGPALDGVTKQKPCGTPSFEPKPNPKKDRHGWLDYPAVVDALAGLTARDFDNNVFTYQKDDVVSIEFKHRVYLRCDNKVLAFVDWGFTAKVTVGADLETSSFSEESAVTTPVITGSNEPDPNRQQDFNNGVATLNTLLN